MSYYRYKFECAQCNFATNDLLEADNHEDEHSHEMMEMDA